MFVCEMVFACSGFTQHLARDPGPVFGLLHSGQASKMIRSL